MKRINTILYAIMAVLLLLPFATEAKDRAVVTVEDLEWQLLDDKDLVLPYVSGTDTTKTDTTFLYELGELLSVRASGRGMWVGVDASKMHCAGDAADSLNLRLFLVDVARNRWTVIAGDTTGSKSDSCDTQLFGYFLSDSIFGHMWLNTNTDSAAAKVTRVGMDGLETYYYLAATANVVEDTANACTLSIWSQVLELED